MNAIFTRSGIAAGYIVAGLTLCLPLRAAEGFAPETVFDTVYFDTAGMLGIGGSRRIVLHRDGRYSFLLWYPWQLPSGGIGPDGVTPYAPPQDGSYIYRKEGASTARLELTTQDRNSVASIELNFRSAGIGTASYTSVVGFEGIQANTGWIGGFEITDLASRDLAPVINMSLRGNVAPGRPLIAGFVVPKGGSTRTLLVRVIGPTLSTFGVSGTWANPEFRVYGEAGAEHRRGRWYFPDVPIDPNGFGAVRKVTSFLGGFALEPGSRDAIGLLWLPAGAGYTIVCEVEVADAGGEALIEVYFLPP